MKDFLNRIKSSLGIDTGDSGSGPAHPDPQASVHAAVPSAKASGFPPASMLREEIVAFIVNKLSAYQAESASDIRGLELFIRCVDAESVELAGVALYAAAPGKFREELHRKLTNNHIHLPANWTFSYASGEQLPEGFIYRQGDLGLNVLRAEQVQNDASPARLEALAGQLAQDAYTLNPLRSQGYAIGRGASPRLDSGRTHRNDICFLEPDDPRFDPVGGAVNQFVSRNHAFIRFQPDQNKYFLYADRGGLPQSGNKIKLLKANGQVERVYIPEVGHELQDGDQIELGGQAILQFTIAGA